MHLIALTYSSGLGSTKKEMVIYSWGAIDRKFAAGNTRKQNQKTRRTRNQKLVVASACAREARAGCGVNRNMGTS
jgi:cell division protein YceG involved in septum cleavage